MPKGWTREQQAVIETQYGRRGWARCPLDGRGLELDERELHCATCDRRHDLPADPALAAPTTERPRRPTTLLPPPPDDDEPAPAVRPRSLTMPPPLGKIRIAREVRTKAVCAVLPVSAGLERALSRIGVRTLGDLHGRTYGELMKAPGVGDKAVAELFRDLRGAGVVDTSAEEEPRTIPMTNVRDRLRAAAAEFADKLYDILHDDLLAQLRQGGATTPVSVAHAPATAIDQHTARLVAWVLAHPGELPAAMSTELGWSRAKLFEVLREAVTTGALSKTGAGRGVHYSVPGAPESHVEAPRAEPSAVPADGAVAQRVVAFVQAHPRCRPKDMEAPLRVSRTALYRALSDATDAGILRKIGGRPHVQYEVVSRAAPTAARGPAPGRSSAIERVVAFVRENPEASLAPLFETGASKSTMLRAVADAVGAGLISKIGRGRYATVGARVDAPVHGKADERLAKIVSFIDEHPGCSAAEIDRGVGLSGGALFRTITLAVERGLISTEGAKPRVRYVVRGSGASVPRAKASLTKLAPAKAPTTRAPTKLAGEALIEAVVAFVRANPECRYSQIQASTGAGEHPLHVALRLARERGLVRVQGVKIKTRYFHARPPITASGPAKNTPAPPAAQSRGEALVEAVIALIRENPGCRNADLVAATSASEGTLRRATTDARSRNAIRLEGTKGKARYFPVEAKPTTIVPPQVAPRTRTIPPPPRPATVAISRIATPSRTTGDRAVDAIFAELDAAIDDEHMHPIRFGALVQAIVAEIRMLRPKFADEHPIARRLDGTIRRLTAIRAERELPYITGLKRDAKANWGALSHEARKRVARFDGDAEASVVKRRTHRPPKATKTNGASNGAVEQELLPKLTALADDHPIVLVGGIKKNEVLEHVREKHGLDVEWAAMQGANTRASEHFIERIKRGAIGAVVVLEGLFSHAQVGAIVDACKTNGVPFAYGDRAGTEGLHRALIELEKGLDERA